MGCDIHCYREKLIKSKWVSADEWIDRYGDGDLDVPYEQQFTDRNYRLFGLISDGVRNSFPFSVKQRGLPDNVSPEVKACSDIWGSDGHSHSYLTKQELLDLLARVDSENIIVKGMKDVDGWDKYKKSLESENPDYSLIFPFCLMTTMDGFVSFETKIPASFMIGESLKRLISVLDDVYGDDQRIVFWFDN